MNGSFDVDFEKQRFLVDQRSERINVDFDKKNAWVFVPCLYDLHTGH